MEFVEKRPPAEGNYCVQTAVRGTQGLEAASIGLNRVREARINVSAFDLRQEPSAVVPHAWDVYGGCRVTGIPTVTALDSFHNRIRVKSRLDPTPCTKKYQTANVLILHRFSSAGGSLP